MNRGLLGGRNQVPIILAGERVLRVDIQLPVVNHIRDILGALQIAAVEDDVLRLLQRLPHRAIERAAGDALQPDDRSRSHFA
ncbi:MAG: hypothetical protein BWY63_03196 [Chloroflexi bacterium ADurb.Bin360]|nr:MAG: hypothetical protein BWY63_03196 [Chloroflexi bacterium ADurb.Bin360]